MIKLNKVPVGSDCLIKEINLKGLIKQRILDLGIIPNTCVHVLRRSPWGDPTAYIIRDTCIALRCEESEKILVEIKEMEE